MVSSEGQLMCGEDFLNGSDITALGTYKLLMVDSPKD